MINTFSARLLLLLESKPLLEPTVYELVTKRVIAAYWRDYEDHKTSFAPAFLTNDILRMWRTLCVNCEARTRTEPEPQKIKRKIKNYQLKHSRLLTCYSAILFLLAIHRRNATVTPADAIRMIALTPTERLEWLANETEDKSGRTVANDLLRKYNAFLLTTRSGKELLKRDFADRTKAATFMEHAAEFGDLMAKAIDVIGANSRFRRLLTV